MIWKRTVVATPKLPRRHHHPDCFRLSKAGGAVGPALRLSFGKACFVSKMTNIVGKCIYFDLISFKNLFDCLKINYNLKF